MFHVQITVTKIIIMLFMAVFLVFKMYAHTYLPAFRYQFDVVAWPTCDHTMVHKDYIDVLFSDYDVHYGFSTISIIEVVI